MILYKYMHPKRISFLQDLLVRFTQPSVFNDPFESRPFMWEIGTDQQLGPAIDGFLRENPASGLSSEDVLSMIRRNQGTMLADLRARTETTLNFLAPLEDSCREGELRT